jgi:hypothetical protein
MLIKCRVWNGEQYISPDYIDRDGVAHWKENSIPESSSETELFTGLHDKHGNEIYEGDLIDLSRDEFPEDTPNPMQVVFEDGSFRRKYIKWDETLQKPILCKNDIEVMHYCVVGTIHDEVKK